MSQINGTPPPRIRLTKYAKSIKGIKENVVASYLLEMKFEGYFTFYQVSPPEHDQEIEITNEGISTFISEYLLKKNWELFWKATMNIFITLANIAVAITAIWALNKEPIELEKIEERLKKIEQENTSQIVGSPNNHQSKRSAQNKDSLSHNFTLNDSIVK